MIVESILELILSKTKKTIQIEEIIFLFGSKIINTDLIKKGLF